MCIIYEEQCLDIFEIPYYKSLKKWLILSGLYPPKNIIIILVAISIISVTLPLMFAIYTSLHAKNIDAMFECLPSLGVCIVAMFKLQNIYNNSENFKKLFTFVAKQWYQLKLNNEIRILEEIIMQGNKMAQIYKNTLLLSMTIFFFVPLIFPILDIVYPLNETRPRQQLYRVNYFIFNHEDYFFYVYFQLVWSSFVCVIVIIIFDWLYILIIHHNSGMFAVCGYQIQKIFAEKVFSNIHIYEQFKNCLIVHSEAIQFFSILDESSRNTYLFLVGTNIMATSISAVQVVLNLDKLEVAIKSAVFLIAAQFHLFILSIPGQILLNHYSNLKNNIFMSSWYNMPIEVQKMFYVMQIRCKKPCSLTACGLYEMNMENFGTVCIAIYKVLNNIYINKY
ncbi:hypothetical protein HZU73_03076 [Apis mellifera caucasica]|uniref:Odorant receptor n=1 Tax=Apis mellifera TaxID=7460 RepID=A0A7M7MQV2_APIME|nr:uncharacterized protein LOC102656805 isoform X1 [Apis mellifera]KAG6801501.1 hypothetical protein HZU73_03076 [Apis mellifera caucasica]KAG9436143.1 hypothetical protein HZU67_02566 [Apis mellifera carnica]|eukprot:XP_026299613.1 uncharacterized protein LOC102656805 isoform X1 [Apis mellifera]